MRIRITDAVKHLLIINVLMFLGTYVIGNKTEFMRWFALFFPENDAFQPWQIVTHMFMHGSFSHILFNMFGLWMFGSAVEQVFGLRKFMVFYLLSGLGAGFIMIAYYYLQYSPIEAELVSSGIKSEDINTMLFQNEVIGNITSAQRLLLQKLFPVFNSTMVGASGALFGVLVAFGMLFPESELMLIFLPIPVKAKYFIPGLIILDIISELSGTAILSPSNTAFVAHIGGALTGFILILLWKKNETDRYRWN